MLPALEKVGAARTAPPGPAGSVPWRQLPTTGDIAKNQATMNPQTIDLVVLGFIGIAALAGMWAGALRVAIGTACTGVVVALMLFGYGPLSSAAERILHLPPRASMIVAFGALALLGQGAVIAVIQKATVIVDSGSVLRRRRCVP